MAIKGHNEQKGSRLGEKVGGFKYAQRFSAFLHSRWCAKHLAELENLG